MEFLEDASEVELIVCVALTGQKFHKLLKEFEDGETSRSGQPSIIAMHRNILNDREEHPCLLSAAGLRDWIEDAQRLYEKGKLSQLSRQVFQTLGSHLDTILPDLIRSDSALPQGGFLDIKLVIEACDEIEYVGNRHNLGVGVSERLCTGFWNSPEAQRPLGSLSPRVGEPNVAFQIAPLKPGGSVTKEALMEIARHAREKLRQDAVAARVRTKDGRWKMVFFDEDCFRRSPLAPPPVHSEYSVALFSGGRSVSESILATIREVSQTAELGAMEFTLELRPVDHAEALEAQHVVLVRHARDDTDLTGPTLDQLLIGVYRKKAASNRMVNKNRGVEREFFLPLAHNCSDDLDPYKDLSSEEPGSACARWNTRLRLTRDAKTPPRFFDCRHVDGHPRVDVVRRRSGESKYIAVSLDPRSNGTGSEAAQSRTVYFPVHPAKTNDSDSAETVNWLRRNWKLDWLDQLAGTSGEPVDVP